MKFFRVASPTVAALAIGLFVADTISYRADLQEVRTRSAGFCSGLHDETDVDRLDEDLVGVVHETPQPEHVSLWLREPGG